MKQTNYSGSKIRRNFGHRLIGSSRMKRVVIKTLLLFPEKIIDLVSKRCWFVGSFEDGWAFALRGDELKKEEFMIFLSDELLRQSESEMRYTIAHEIGHVVLGHKNSILEPQSKKEVAKQEREAHTFARKYLD